MTDDKGLLEVRRTSIALWVVAFIVGCIIGQELVWGFAGLLWGIAFTLIINLMVPKGEKK